MTSIVLQRQEIQSPVAQRLIEELNAVVLELYPEEGTEESFALESHEVAAGSGTFLVAYLDGQAVGCGAVRKLDGGTAELKRMYVRPQARRRGVAAAILVELEAEARRLGVATLVLETGPRQPEAIALYRREGFAEAWPYGSHQEHPLSVYMAKKL
jgi:GNAT superfamily N-acetyltransferase